MGAANEYSFLRSPSRLITDELAISADLKESLASTRLFSYENYRDCKLETTLEL